MVITNQLKNQHLLWRAGFGPMAEDLGSVATGRQKSFLEALWKASSKKPQPLDVTDNAFKGLFMGVDQAVALQKRDLSPEQKKELRRQSQEDIKSLNLAWLNEMVNSDAQLREKMSLFWHGHFASRNINIFYQQLLLDSVRQNALENFGDLLREVSKSAAMINFLNNNQNRKDHPNENFAREVMELFTMGRGNYTEQDVKEAARAFTGWGANLKGEFQFRKGQHDDGEKTFLGRTGRFDGDDILNILLEQRQTARYITRKLYRYLVNEEVDETRVDWLAGRFYQGNYDLKGLLHDIFGSDWFYDARNIGTRIKSPVELLAGMRRLLPMKIANEQVQIVLQRLLGQVLFYPPNVAGWPGGPAWIDSSTLMFRLRIPELIAEAGEFGQRPKDDDDQMMGMKDGEEMAARGAENRAMRIKERRNARQQGGKGGQIIQAQIDWAPYLQRFANIPREQLLAAISDVTLQGKTGINEELLKKYADSGTREDFIRTATIRLMSTPEYQLC